MKKLILLSIFSIMLIGCGESVKHPVAGHVYACYYDNAHTSASKAYAFYTSSKCEMIIFGSDSEYKVEHLVWRLNGTKIAVLHDNSFFWKAEVRGTSVDEFTYNSADNTLTSTLDGEIYYRTSK